METKVNVAKQSTAGHYVEKSKQVINLDEVSEMFLVENDSILTTKNHTTLHQTDCFISPQKVYNPFSKMFERAKD